MVDTILYKDLPELPAWDSTKILAVETDGAGAGGWKAYVSTDTTMADDSDALLSTQKAIKAYADATNSYTNAVSTPITIGGIPAGSTFANQTNAQMWTALLYPYQSPAFSSFSILGQAVTVEVGSAISGTKTFVWGTTNPSNVQSNSISIVDVTGGNITLQSSLSNTGSSVYTFPSPIVQSTASPYTWSIRGVNTQSIQFSRLYTVSWLWRKYFGTSPNATLTEEQIEALENSQLSATASATYAFAASGYKYMAWPTSFAQPTSFKDSETLLDVAMDIPHTQDLTNSFGVMTNYTVYRTFYQLGGAINIIVS